MSGSVVRVRSMDGQIQATCVVHGVIGRQRQDSPQGRNAVGAELRAHIGLAHDGSWLAPDVENTKEGP